MSRSIGKEIGKEIGKKASQFSDGNRFISTRTYFIAGLSEALKRLRGVTPRKQFTDIVGIPVRTLAEIEKLSAITRPNWCKLKMKLGEEFFHLKSLCPEGWGAITATSPSPRKQSPSLIITPPGVGTVLAVAQTRMTAVSLGPDGNCCAFGGFDSILHLYSLKDHDERLLALHTATVRHIIHLPTTGELLSAGDDGCIYAVDPAACRQRLIGRHDFPIYALYYHQPSGRALAGDKAGNIHAWNLSHSPWQKLGDSIKPSRHAPEIITSYDHGAVFTICGNNDFSTIYFSGVAGEVFSLTFASNTIRKVADLGSTVFCLAYDDTTAMLYAGCANGKIRCISLASFALSEFEGHTDSVRWLVLSNTRRQLFSSSKDKTIRCWNLQTPLRLVIGSHEDYVYQMTISPKDSELISAGGDGKIILWQLE